MIKVAMKKLYDTQKNTKITTKFSENGPTEDENVIANHLNRSFSNVCKNVVFKIKKDRDFTTRLGAGENLIVLEPTMW